MQILTLQDIDMLIEGVRSWMRAAETSALPQAMLVTMVSCMGKEENEYDKEQQKAAAKGEFESTMDEAKKETEGRKEQGEALIAKLYVLRHTIAQEETGLT